SRWSRPGTSSYRRASGLRAPPPPRMRARRNTTWRRAYGASCSFPPSFDASARGEEGVPLQEQIEVRVEEERIAVTRRVRRVAQEAPSKEGRAADLPPNRAGHEPDPRACFELVAGEAS